VEDVPLSLGYKMPAEWEPHEATWLSWPKNEETFPRKLLPAVEATYVEIVAALSRSERVNILVDDPKAEKRVSALLESTEDVSFVKIPTADVWVRDYAPIYVKGKDLALTKWDFNAWGEKYDDLKPDDKSGWNIARWTGLRVFRPGIVLEGGSVDANGRGTLLTTEQCLLNPNRNPALSKEKVEGYLEDYLGASDVIWLGSGIEGDDTDGHVDDVARFVAADKVVCAIEDDPTDENHAPLQENRKVLAGHEDSRGRRLALTELPMPARVDSGFGRLPASYLNFYVATRDVLVPTFDCPQDETALRILGSLFQNKRITGIRCRKLVHGLGTLHCITQQAPKAQSA
jgi:agmatine deiminase